MRPLLTLVALAAVADSFSGTDAAPKPRVWQRFTLTDPEALCLDGSPGAYYFLPGVNSTFGNSTFVLHLQGGGWCASDEDCRQRAFDGPVYPGEASLGSSALWGPGPCTPELSNSTPPCVSDGGSGGMLSSNHTLNPTLSDAAKVWVGYCSGDSFLGARAAPKPVNATASVFFRGRAILSATISALAANHGLGDGYAGSVVLSGCSAGGAATFANADYVTSAVRAYAPGARVVAAPGAGMFLDVPAFNGRGFISENLTRYVFEASNAAASTLPACLAAPGGSGPPADNTWRCLYAATLLPFISTPLFIINSLSDLASQSLTMGLGCRPSTGDCSAAQLAYLDLYGATMRDLVLNTVSRGGRHGAFLVSCDVHMLEAVDGAWGAIHVQNATLAETFKAWWGNDDGGIAVDDLWTQGTGVHGGNPDCIHYGPVPSRPSYA